MMRLKKSRALGRMIRQDDPEELAIPTWMLIREAIQTGRSGEALALLDYGLHETKTLHDGLCSTVDSLVTRLAGFDEEEVYKFFRARYEPVARQWLSETPDASESLQRAIEYQRGHGGSCKVNEERDRYVVTCDPCGSGGQLRRTKDVGVAKKAYFWTWSKKDVPYYCVHCCVMWEILPVELRGYPIRINLFSSRSENPCIHLYYKNPERIPDEYYKRISQSKPLHRKEKNRKGGIYK